MFNFGNIILTTMNLWMMWKLPFMPKTSKTTPRSFIENVAQFTNSIGRDGFEQINTSEIKELLELQDDNITETDSEVMQNPVSIEEKDTTSTEKTINYLQNLSECLRIPNELCDCLF